MRTSYRNAVRSKPWIRRAMSFALYLLLGGRVVFRGDGSRALRKLVGASDAMRRVRAEIRRIAPAPIPVMILGETGTGKELCAAAIARLSGEGSFVPVNCAAFADGTVESELFGHARGSFTGAYRNHEGLIAEANGGTLFLDELGEVPAGVQVKLLRTLESGEYRAVGSAKTYHAQFRILAATNADLDTLLSTGRLREDLFYRLGAVRLHLPPLRDRPEDIVLLADRFLQDYAKRTNDVVARVGAGGEDVLRSQRWPGNVRQLRNVIEGACALAGPGAVIDVDHIVPLLGSAVPTRDIAADFPTLDDAARRVERRVILEALRRTNGSRQQAAKLLGISEATLYRKLARHVEPGDDDGSSSPSGAGVSGVLPSPVPDTHNGRRRARRTRSAGNGRNQSG